MPNNITINDATGGSYFQPLSWSLRLKVALGVAKGLTFLRNAETKGRYRDFSTSNVLLDSVCFLFYTQKHINILYLFMYHI
jgi:hypothetical protein